jgi:PadR family transcriptional regulator, regulatory protein PadR
MTRGDFLGEFELYVLAALAQLGDDAYGVTIRAAIEERANRMTALGAVYTTLQRLADKGYVTFWVSEPLPIPGGRARKHARLTADGRRALRDSVRALERMLSGVQLGAPPKGTRA